MSDKSIKKEDRELFRQTVGAVKPMVADRLHLRPIERPRPVPKSHLIDPQGPLLGSGGHPVAAVGDSDTLSYAAPGLPRNILKKMRRGFFAIDAELDLHGLTEREAKRQLLDFLRFCTADGLQCVHIIHGKGFRSLQGHPILKNRVNLWLRQHAEVLAFCSSKPADGGTGAVYVLLRNH